MRVSRDVFSIIKGSPILARREMSQSRSESDSEVISLDRDPETFAQLINYLKVKEIPPDLSPSMKKNLEAEI